MKKTSAWIAAVLFALQFSVMGFLFRPFFPARDIIAFSVSFAFWFVLARLLEKRVLRVIVAAVVALIVALEWDYFHRFHVTLDAQALACARQNWADVRGTVGDSLQSLFVRTLLLFFAEFALLELSKNLKVRAPLKILGFAATALALGGFLVARRTPEFELTFGTGRLLKSQKALTVNAAAVPITTTPLRIPPNVLFILSESIRASDYCDVPGTPCPTAPRTEALLPQRLPLRYMRSVGSYTSIALSGLYTGVHQVRSREEILATPTLFDFLRALRTPGDATIPTRYISGHFADYLMGRDLHADTMAPLEVLGGHDDGTLPKEATRGADGMLLDRYLEELQKSDAPDFVMLHLSGTHVRYFIDPNDAPFQPWTTIVSYEGMDQLRNKYKNAIYTQDKIVDAAVKAFIAKQADKPYVIFFTSDHGEAFNEHEAIHHGQSLHEEQAHVPAWIVNGNGAIDEASWNHLREHADRPLTHLDILPTFLDLYGVYDAIAFQPFKAKLDGRSLLRAPSPMAHAIPISNCPSWFECPIANWGVQKDETLLVANVWNAHWNCSNVKTHAEWLDTSACRELVEVSKGFYPNLPNGLPNR